MNGSHILLKKSNSDEFFKKKENLKVHLQHDPAVGLFDIYPKELKSDVYTETCTEDF